tara:strand:+ start:218 stop:1138 length:921 start_codon:yes stop_codon:yes gene_type:complete
MIVKLNKLFITAFISLWCLPIFGSETHFPLTMVNELSAAKKQGLQKLLNVSFGAEFDGFSCSGTFINNQGMFLTADHCIKSCFLGENDDQYTDYRSFNRRDLGPAQWLNFRRFYPNRVPENITCETVINGETKKSKLVVASNGRLNPYFPKQLEAPDLIEKYKEFVESGAGWPTGDFAILELTDKPKTNCLQLGNRLPSKGETIQSISFPLMNLNERIPFYSSGVLLDEEKSEPNSFVSTVDAETGSSGASLIGEDGKILGVVSIVVDIRDPVAKIKKTLKVTSVLGILKSIRETLGYDIICKTEQ